MPEHILKVDGYHTSAEQTLEGVMFEVHIQETDDDFVITGVDNPSDSGMGSYVSRFSDEWLAEMRAEIRTRVQENLDHLRSQGDIKAEFDEWDADIADNDDGLERIDLLNEI